VNARHAVLDFSESYSAGPVMRQTNVAIESESWATLDGILTGGAWDALSGAYETMDGHVRIHTNFPQ
jgi:hypothetical protein